MFPEVIAYADEIEGGWDEDGSIDALDGGL